MNFDRYTELAIRTLKPLDYRDQITHCVMGLMGELGELADAIKKHVVYGKELDLVNVQEEAGDLLYFAAAMAHTLGVKVEPKEPKSWSSPAHYLVDLMGHINVLCHCETDRAGLVLSQLVRSINDLLEFYDLHLEKAMQANIEKLAKRYGDKYSDFAALNRDLKGEREVLEKT